MAISPLRAPINKLVGVMNNVSIPKIKWNPMIDVPNELSQASFSSDLAPKLTAISEARTLCFCSLSSFPYFQLTQPTKPVRYAT